MAYSRIKVWIPGEVLTANDLNAEFTGCVGNENDLLTRITNEATSRATADTILQTNIDTIYDSTAGEIEANLVVEDSIKADAVTVAKIKDAEITLAKMAASAKSPAAGTEGLRKLGTGALDAMPGNTSLIPADGSVTEAKLGAGAVTMAKMKAPTAVATTIIARWQEAETATTGTLATLYVTVSGNIRVSCQLVRTDAVLTISKNGSSVKTLTGTGPYYVTFTYDMAVTLGDRIDFSFAAGGANSMVRYGRIYSGTSIGAVS